MGQKNEPVNFWGLKERLSKCKQLGPSIDPKLLFAFKSLFRLSKNPSLYRKIFFTAFFSENCLIFAEFPQLFFAKFNRIFIDFHRKSSKIR